MNIIRKFLEEEKGNSEIIETSIALIFIFMVFIAFFIYSTSAREKVVMNYASKEGARAYMLSKDTSYGMDMARTYLNIGGVNNTNVSTGDNSIRVVKDLNIFIPFYRSESIKLVSEFEFHEELDPFWYQKDIYQDGWYYERWRKSTGITERNYDDDAVEDPYR